MRGLGATLAFSLLAVPALAQLPPDKTRLAVWHSKKGLELMRAESWEEAATEFKSAIQNDPLMTMAHYNLGQCRMAQKRYVEAVAAYRTSKEVVVEIGALSEKERGARDRARRDEIHELKNDLARTNSMKGVNVEKVTTEIQDRIRLLESMEYRDADRIHIPAEIPLALGSAYFRQERFEDAEREYQEAVTLNKRLGAAHNNLAVIYLLTGRLDEAEESVKLAEKAGFAVNPRFKDDLKRAKIATQP